MTFEGEPDASMSWRCSVFIGNASEGHLIPLGHLGRCIASASTHFLGATVALVALLPAAETLPLMPRNLRLLAFAGAMALLTAIATA